MPYFSSPGYFGPQRNSNEIAIYLSPNHPCPEAPPVELQQHIPQNIWNTRIPAITRVASQYCKPLLERIWLLLALLSIVSAPIVTYSVISHIDNFHDDDGFRDGFDENRFDNIDFNEENRRFVEARAISFGVFIGLLLLFYLPMLVWKWIGAKRVNAMVSGWAREDRAARGPGVSLPLWKVRSPRVFSNDITLTITLPLGTPPSSFHPDAYLPSYINGPMDADAQIYGRTNQGPQNYAQQTFGNLPLYDAEKTGYGGTAPQRRGDNPFGDEKRANDNPFEDVKV